MPDREAMLQMNLIGIRLASSTHPGALDYHAFVPVSHVEDGNKTRAPTNLHNCRSWSLHPRLRDGFGQRRHHMPLKPARRELPAATHSEAEKAMRCLISGLSDTLQLSKYVRHLSGSHRLCFAPRSDCAALAWASGERSRSCKWATATAG